MQTAARLLAVAALAGVVGCTAQTSRPLGPQTDGGTGHFGGLDGGGGINGVCGTAASFGTAALDTCINAKCCASFDACHADTGCPACLTNPSGAGCAANSAFTAFNTCAVNGCGSGGGGGGGGADGGSGSGSGSGVCGSGASTGDTTLDTCIDANCCSSFNACIADTACTACLADPTATGCDANTTLTALATCLSANCGGGGAGGAGDICGSGLTTQDDAVDICLNTNCCSTLNACVSDATCDACFSDTAPASCESNTKLNAFFDCWDANACDSAGGGGDGVCGLGGSFGDDAIDACIDGHCCTPLSGCVNNATCLDCLTGDATTGCDSNALYHAFDSCWTTNGCG